MEGGISIHRRFIFITTLLYYIGAVGKVDAEAAEECAVKQFSKRKTEEGFYQKMNIRILNKTICELISLSGWCIILFFLPPRIALGTNTYNINSSYALDLHL